MVLIVLGKLLLLAICSECFAAFLLGYRSAASLSAIALVNVISNPPLNLAIIAHPSWFLGPASSGAVIAAEIFVVLVEWLLLNYALGGPPGRNIKCAAIMNLFSYALGVWVQPLL